MKRILSYVCVTLLMAVLFQTMALAADSITLSSSAATAQTGDTLTVSGKAAANTWITIRGLDSDGSIVCFSAVLSDASGDYSDSFKVPEMADGTLTLVAGYGSTTASVNVTVQTIYTVTFDKNGGTTDASPTTQSVLAGGTVTLPTAPTRYGYTFSAWNTAAGGGGTAFTASTTVNARHPPCTRSGRKTARTAEEPGAVRAAPKRKPAPRQRYQQTERVPVPASVGVRTGPEKRLLPPCQPETWTAFWKRPPRLPAG